jgi:hypothetical protein
MEPQDNQKLALRKAISAHEEAEAALADLMTSAPHRRYAEMLERIRSNLAELRAETGAGDP